MKRITVLENGIRKNPYYVLDDKRDAEKRIRKFKTIIRNAEKEIARISKHGEEYITPSGHKEITYFREEIANANRNIEHLHNAVNHHGFRIFPNPYASEQQRKFFHAAEKRGQIPHEVVEEYDRESAGLELPERANAKYKTPRSQKLHALKTHGYKYGVRWDTYRNLYWKGFHNLEDAREFARKKAKTVLDTAIYDISNDTAKFLETGGAYRNPNEAYLLTIASKRDAENLQSVNVIDVSTGKNLGTFKSVISAENFARRRGLKLLKNPKLYPSKSSGIAKQYITYDSEGLLTLIFADSAGQAKQFAKAEFGLSDNHKVYASPYSAKLFHKLDKESAGLELLKNPVKPRLDYRQRSTHYVVTAKGRVVKHGTDFDKLLEYAEKHNENYDSKYYVITALDYMHKKFINER